MVLSPLLIDCYQDTDNLLIVTHGIIAKWKMAKGTRTPFKTFPIATVLAAGLLLQALWAV